MRVPYVYSQIEKGSPTGRLPKLGAPLVHHNASLMEVLPGLAHRYPRVMHESLLCYYELELLPAM